MCLFQSFVMNNMYHEFFVFYLYFEQLFVDEDYVDTRLRILRPLATPLLLRRSFCVNRKNAPFLEMVFVLHAAVYNLNCFSFQKLFLRSACSQCTWETSKRTWTWLL